MRKYDKKNKIYMGIIMIFSIILIIIFSLFIAKVISNGKIEYYLDNGSILYDKDKNLIRIEDEAVLKIKWNDQYYLNYQDDVDLLGSNPIVYNPTKNVMQLYGTYYEVTSLGEDKVIVHNDETIVKTVDSKFYKIADRKYLLIDPSIKTEDEQLATSNYLIVELDTLGNAVLYNNSVNVKTFKPTTLVTSTYSFDIANEKLIYGEDEIDLKKIIGSTNKYVEATDDEQGLDDEENSTTENGGNGQGGNQVVTPPETNNGGGNGTDDNGADDTGEGNGSGGAIDEIIDATRTTSVISVTASVGYITVDYVVYDPLDEFESVFVEVRDNTGNLVSVCYLDKASTNFVITGLKPNIKYNLSFKYRYYDDNNQIVEQEFDNTNITVGTPTISITIDKVTSSRVYYTINLDKDFKLSGLRVNLNSDLDDGSKVSMHNDYGSSDLSGNSVSGYFTYDKLGKFVTISLSNATYNGYGVDLDVKYKFVRS